MGIDMDQVSGLKCYLLWCLYDYRIFLPCSDALCFPKPLIPSTTSFFDQKRSLWAIGIHYGYQAALIWDVLSCCAALLIQCSGGPLPSNIKTVIKVPSLHLGYLRCKMGGGFSLGIHRPICAMSRGRIILFLLLLRMP